MLEQLYQQVRSHRIDAAWVEQHSASLKQNILTGLQDDTHRVMAVDLLLHIFPMLVWRDDIKQWEPIINEAVERLSGRYIHQAASQQPEYVITQTFIIRRLDHTSQVKPAKKRRRRRLNPRKLFEDYLIILMTLCCTRQIEPDVYRAEDLLHFARNINNQAIYHRTYSAMACIYNTKGQYAQALDLAQIAYAYWQGHQGSHNIDLVISAHETARAYQGLGQLVQAARWLLVAQQALNETEYAALAAHIQQEYATLSA